MVITSFEDKQQLSSHWCFDRLLSLSHIYSQTVDIYKEFCTIKRMIIFTTRLNASNRDGRLVQINQRKSSGALTL